MVRNRQNGKERKGKRKEEEEKGNTPNPPEGVLIGIAEPDSKSHPIDPTHPASPTTHPEPRVLPHRWRHISRGDRKNHRVLANNRLMQRIGTWFGRRPDTLWNLAEAIALSQLNPPRDETELLETYYLAPLDRDADYRRRDLLTLLNHWHSELDRARIWQAESPAPCPSGPHKR